MSVVQACTAPPAKVSPEGTPTALAPPAAPASVETFLEHVVNSRLVGRDKVSALRKQLNGETGIPLTPAQLGERLVEQGQLTRWQMQKILAGKHEGFVLGSYRLRDHIDNGSIAAVFEAEHCMTHERVALKILLPHLADKTSYLERFHREARAAQKLNHPNVVQVLDVGREDYPSTGPLNYLVTEFSTGKTLDHLVQKGGPLEPDTATEYIRQAAKGLARAHACGVIHRNMKPSNLLLDDGDIKIMNLGVARFLDEDDSESLTLRYQEKVIGTAGFMAPEQMQNSHEVDARTDLYSLGCVYYFLLSGRAPFAGSEGVTLMLKHLTENPVSLQQLRPAIPAEMEAICSKMMAKRPDARYATAGELASDLNTCLVRSTIGWARPKSQAAV